MDYAHNILFYADITADVIVKLDLNTGISISKLFIIFSLCDSYFAE